MDTVAVGRPEGDAELGALGAILAQVFTVADGTTATRAWMERVGLANVRVARRGGAVAGGLLVIPMGQWFGGRSVPMAGIAGVAIAPEHRARGVAATLMRETLRGLRADGFALSTLYPATQTIYRRVGYERAGVRMRISVPVKAIDVRDRDLPVRPVTEADHEAVEACYAERARGTAGMLDRSPSLWRRVRGEPGKMHGYLVEEAGRVTGYTCFQHEPTPEQLPNLLCNDLVATTPGAARRLLALFADHRSLANDVAWSGGPSDPFLFHLGEQRDAKAAVRFVWMLRVLDVPAAFAARGWPAAVTAQLHLDVLDDVLPENAGRWLVRIEGGRAEARRGGEGRLHCDVRGLAALYAGSVGPADAAAAGVLTGTAEDVAAATAVLAGPTPWMADHF
jgi:predicted acetyltransferase